MPEQDDIPTAEEVNAIVNGPDKSRAEIAAITAIANNVGVMLERLRLASLQQLATGQYAEYLMTLQACSQDLSLVAATVLLLLPDEHPLVRICKAAAEGKAVATLQNPDGSVRLATVAEWAATGQVFPPGTPVVFDDGEDDGSGAAPSWNLRDSGTDLGYL